MDIKKASSLLSVTVDNTPSEIVDAAHVVVNLAISEGNLPVISGAYEAMKVLLAEGGQTTPEEADRYFTEANAVIAKIKDLADRSDVDMSRLKVKKVISERVIADNQAAIATEKKALALNKTNKEECILQHDHLKSAYLLDLAGNLAAMGQYRL